jgi:hypothetical protein
MTDTTSNTTAIAYNPALTLRDLDFLSYPAKLRHWTRQDAWRPGGAALVFKNPSFLIGNVGVDKGNIVRSKPLIGRPCFGIATAFLRYQNHTRYVNNRGLMKAGRCHDCKAREACQWVVEKRLRAHPSIEACWAEWLKAGGPSAFAKPKFKQSHTYRVWGALIRELQRHSFTSVNDQHLAKAYEEADREAKEKDKQRKAQERRRARRSGDIDAADMFLLEQAASRRRKSIYGARLYPRSPSTLVRTPWRSLYDMMDVWLGREVMRARKMKPNAPNIARWIIETGHFNDSKNDAALASRVAKDLKRIARFEKTSWEASVLLPPLDRASEFTSDQAGSENTPATI